MFDRLRKLIGGSDKTLRQTVPDIPADQAQPSKKFLIINTVNNTLLFLAIGIFAAIVTVEDPVITDTVRKNGNHSYIFNWQSLIHFGLELAFALLFPGSWQTEWNEHQEFVTKKEQTNSENRSPRTC